MRMAGNIPGTFRYAEPGDGDEALCQKLQGLFDVAAKSSSIALNIRLDDIGFSEDIQFPININKKGLYQTWIPVEDDFKEESLTIIVNSHLDKEVTVPVEIIENIGPDKNRLLLDKWIGKIVDSMASEVLVIIASLSQEYNNASILHCALIQQRIEAITNATQNENMLERLQFLSQQVDAIISGQSVNMGKLGDLRFSSQFAVTKSKPKPAPKPIHVQIEPLELKEETRVKERYVRYNRNSKGKKRNTLQEEIVSKNNNRITDRIAELISKATIEDIKYNDIDGNNTLHLTAYSGQDLIMAELIKKFPDGDINCKNPDGETPFTLAIKGQGFWKVMKILMKIGAEIPDGRKKSLQEYAVDHEYSITGKLLGGIGDSSKEVDHSMTSEYVEFMYEISQENEVNINVDCYLDVCLSKSMYKLSKTLIKKHEGKPSIDMLLNYCIPPKPDHPQVDKYLDLTKLVFNARPDLLEQMNEDKETPLFKSCEKGNLPHVQYFLKKGALVDCPNILGNTPLWIACAKRYPCIIQELLHYKADVNYANLKGNPPMYGLCQKQNTPIKIVKQLLAARARVDAINKKTKDTLILICCRNNKTEILKLLLDYVDEDFVKYKAEIDGFDAMMASVEANNPECIEILHEYGIDLETPTADDNPILPRASPLHLAAYYNSHDACNKLLSKGANPNSTDINEQTPLHLAVIQGNIPIIRLLRTNCAKINIQDKFGNTPASYCRNRTEIRKVLVNPALDILQKLCRGGFTKLEEKEACKILSKYSGQPGFLQPRDALNVTGDNGFNPLMHASINSLVQVVKIFIELGVDPNIENYSGTNSFLWAKWINNPRIKRMLSGIDSNKTKIQLERLEKASKISMQDASILFLSGRPDQVVTLQSSGIDTRMENFINYIRTVHVMRGDKDKGKGEDKDIIPIKLILEKEKEKENSLIEIFEQKERENECQDYSSLLWDAKVFCVNSIASGNTFMEPNQILTLNLYTSNSLIPDLVNKTVTGLEHVASIDNYVKNLVDSLMTLPNFEGEVFIGANDVDRKCFQIGNEFSWSTFISASTLWKVAMEHVTEFDSKKKKGTIFIVKSKTGRYVGQYSQFSYDGEVIFLPTTKFKVNAWYRGDKICLGQENIREHTFGIKDEEQLRRMTCNNTSLIIELIEV